MMYGERTEWKQEGPLSWRTFLIALALHVVLGLAFWCAAKILLRPPEVIIPIDMTIVPPWAEVDPEDPNPDPNPPPEVKPPEPKPKPTPKPDVPKVDESKMDAVVKEQEKPKKPEFKKAELKKPEEKKPPEKKKPEFKPGDFKKNAKLIKNIPKNIPRTGKGTAKEKPLSAAEIQKALNAGAKYGASNQLAANEEQRCISLVAAALKRHWTEEFQWTDSLQSVHLKLRFGPGGRILDARIVQRSGDPQVDRSVLAAAKNTGSVAGLTPAFLERYPELVIEMKPTRR